jgi:hypothetical protein
MQDANGEESRQLRWRFLVVFSLDTPRNYGYTYRITYERET